MSPSLSFAQTSDLGEVPSSWNNETKFVGTNGARTLIVFEIKTLFTSPDDNSG